MAKLHRDSGALVVLLGCIIAIGPLSTDMYLASLPSLTTVFDTDAARVQLTLSAFMVGFALTQLIYGPLSDRLGRKPVLLGGVAIYTLASLACLLAFNIEMLIVARFIQALGACSGVVIGRAIVRDLHERERAAQVMAMIAMVMAITPALAPVAGGYLQQYFGWQANFVAMACCGLMLWLLVALLLAESNMRRDPAATRPGPMLRNFASLLRNRAYCGYALCVAAGYGGLFSFISGSSFVLIQVYGLSETAYGYSFGAIAFTYASGAMIASRMAPRLGMQRVIAIGSTICLVAGLSMAALVWGAPAFTGGNGHWLLVEAPMLLYMVGFAMVLPIAQAGALQPFPHIAGSAAALMGFLQMSAAAVIGIIVGHALDGTALPLALAVAFCSLVILAGYLTVRRAAARP
ncbi:multidrug effflux MFS transporter [Ferrovibrio sp.]|uniref:multidrug effflux MFS transporter n=1 Tax=Ferrovibrio sp. TaxID=1917215 RepID=UPI0025C2F13F|nr:multidrug effflux MFS transporter [Ferrovibrio sp.]MBX3455144.1 multidrug effflux MFS transporter [Ferrovibrio sp.]